jgi:ribosome-binding ATPase YchF (GTP1/OBG family)
MADPPTIQKEVILKMLDSVKDRFSRYDELRQRSATSIDQNDELNNTIVNLKSKLANIKTAADTYDREYLDRMADKPLSGFARSRGISTLQDWVLLLFFINSI